MSEFQDIRIVDIDKDGISRPDDNMDMFDIPFKLSTVPPQEWATIFDVTSPRVWRTSSRRAWLNGSRIILHAGEDDIFDNHKEELESRVEKTNSKYREHLADIEKRERREHEIREAQMAQESELKQRLSSLKFE